MPELSMPARPPSQEARRAAPARWRDAGRRSAPLRADEDPLVWGRASQWTSGPAGRRYGPDLLIPARLRMERGLREAYPDLRRRRQQRRGGPVDVYSATVEVPGAEERRISVEYDWRRPSRPLMNADGPTTSPHRYAERERRRLCVWHPDDPVERRWMPDDGLLALFGMITVHLFKEAWWRRTGEWLGDEAPHDVVDGPVSDVLERVAAA